MSFPTYTFAADATSGAPGGDYVSAQIEQKLEQTLSKLVWHVLYGKAHEASGVAVDAEQILTEMKKAKAA